MVLLREYPVKVIQGLKIFSVTFFEGIVAMSLFWKTFSHNSVAHKNKVLVMEILNQKPNSFSPAKGCVLFNGESLGRFVKLKDFTNPLNLDAVLHRDSKPLVTVKGGEGSSKNCVTRFERSHNNSKPRKGRKSFSGKIRRTQRRISGEAFA